MTKTAHIPERTCRICRKKMAKDILSRYVMTEEGYVLDQNKTRPGRGTYLCKDCQSDEKKMKGFLRGNK